MKIAILLTDINSTGGVARVVSNLANSFNKIAEYEIHVISCFKSESKSLKYHINEEVKIKYLEIDSNIKLNKIKKQLYFIKKIKEAIKYENYDIVISTNAHINIYSSIAIKNTKTKLIGCEHGSYNHLAKGWRVLTNIFYKNLDKLVILTPKEINRYKLSEKSIEVIENMSYIKTGLKSNLNNNVISMITRIDENKNLINAIDVFKRVNDKHKEWKLNIYGEGDIGEISKISSKIKELKLQDNVFIYEFEKNTEKIYLNSDIVLLTSKSEGLPMVLIEAATYGVPCVSYDIKTGPADIIIDNETGFVIEPFNTEKMIMKVKYIIENKKIKVSMGNMAKIKSVRFSEDVILKKWLVLFENILGRN